MTRLVKEAVLPFVKVMSPLYPVVTSGLMGVMIDSGFLMSSCSSA